MDEGGRKLDSQALGESKTPIARIKVGPVWNLKNPAKFRRGYHRNNMIWNSKVNQGKNQTQKPNEGSLSQLMPLE